MSTYNPKWQAKLKNGILLKENRSLPLTGLKKINPKELKWFEITMDNYRIRLSHKGKFYINSQKLKQPFRIRDKDFKLIYYKKGVILNALMGNSSPQLHFAYLGWETGTEKILLIISLESFAFCLAAKIKKENDFEYRLNNEIVDRKKYENFTTMRGI